MQELDIGALPIHDKNQLVGMVTDRDLVVRALSNGKVFSKKTALDIMSKEIVCCHESEELGDAVRLMGQKKILRLPVLNDKGQSIGKLSLGVLSHAASHELCGEVLSTVSAHHI